jgi:hypothetical protein
MAHDHLGQILPIVQPLAMEKIKNKKITMAFKMSNSLQAFALK